MKLKERLAALITLYAIWPGLVLGGTLAEVPLSLRGAVPSNVLFDMSVEWPTAITAAYPGVSDYTKSTQYEGLFDPGLCYDYDDSLAYFIPAATATATHGCTGHWSGNFLNWATMTGLDGFRYATTGGNRVIDTTDLTVIERTYITNNGSAGSFFPQKSFNPQNGEFTDSTAYAENATFRIDNWSKGSQMDLSWTTSQTTTVTTNKNAQSNCTGTVSTGTPYCSGFTATINAINSTGTCGTWSGSGLSSGDPFKCTAFNNFVPIGAAPTLNSTNCLNTSTKGSGSAKRWICTQYDTRFSYPVTTTTNTDHTKTFNVRVKACDKGYPLRENCQQYSSGFYKPVGEIQRNGEKMRFGVFAYYNAPDIDNAVMRARLKQVSPSKYSSSASTIDNPYKEWDAATGVLILNPDAQPYENDATKSDANQSYAKNGIGNKSPVNNSGVINYLNKFGSNAASAQRYKSYDDISKIYYESLRYLRKLGPTADFYQNATIAGNDGFPIITDWYKGGTDDPIPYYCQKNYIIAMGDQFTHCDKRLPGGSLTPFSNHTAGSPTNGDQCGTASNPNNSANDENSLSNGDPLNVTTLTNAIGGFEGLGALGSVRTGSGGNASYYMAGLAHWAATNDIRPPGPNDLKNPLVEVNDSGTIKKVEMPQTVKTFVIDVEENQTLGANSVTPGGAYRSQFWYTAKWGGGGGEYGYYNQDSAGKVIPGGDVNGLHWSRGNATYTSPKQTYTGDWPKTLLRAGNPAGMIASIKEALATVDAETGTNSALSQSSGDLRTGNDAFIYRATFNSAVWSGELQAFKIKSDGTLDGTPVWSASTALPTPGNRQIVSFNDGLMPDNTTDTAATKGPIAFDPTKFNENLSARQKAFLSRNGNNVVDNRGDKRMAFLRGDSSYEPNGTPGGFFASTDDPKESWRSRTTTVGTTSVTNKLGDIVNSNPIYVGSPIPNLPGKEYNLFAQSVKDRKPMIYAGANDGMLHGFDASDGKELIAYIPSPVYSRLSQLTSATYTHKYFVDGTPTISEACKGSCADQNDWYTVLVGGLNAGGQGIYALDVTNPDNFASAQANPSSVVLWEFTDRDDPDLGFTFSRPVVRLMNNGKWAAIFGNGFNNTVADGKPSTTGRAYLYILPLDGPSGAPWSAGSNYYKIELNSAAETGTPLNPANGLGSVAAVDRDLDGTVDYIYAGDRRGNVWKVDVSSSNHNDWKTAFGSATTPVPLFTAKHKSGATTTPQTITTGVEVSAHPNGGFLVMFGTGSFIESTDSLAPFNTDSFYGIWDKDDGTATTDGTTVTRDDLQKQKVIATVSSGGIDYLFQSSCKPNYSDATVDSNANGDLCPSDIAFPDGAGQQLGWVFDLPQDGERVASDMPFLQSGILTVTSLQPSADPCAGDTIGREYNLNYLTGGAASTGVFDLNGDGVINNLDLISLVDGATGSDTGSAASGRVFAGGASKTPARFILRHGGTGSGSGSSTFACPDFIPGWGCPSELAPQRNCQRWVEDVVSDELLKAGAFGLGGTKKCLPGKTGRLTWRQLTK